MLQTNVVENRTTPILYSRTFLFFFENRAIYENVEKYCRTEQATDGNKAHAHFMLNTQVYKHTLRICNTYSFSTAVTVTRTRLNVTLYVHCLSCLT